MPYSQTHNGIEITTLAALGDNYVYLIRAGDEAAIVDPGDARPVMKHVRALRIRPATILVTHHHFDHTGGNQELKEEFGCAVVGPRDRRVPALDKGVGEGESVAIGATEWRVMLVPGHTRTHIAFHCQAIGVLLTGDFLFTGGCGRLFEGTAEDMWKSLQRIMELPDDTVIYCGHDYAQENLEFARTIEPENQNIPARLAEISRRRAAGEPSVPSSLLLEKQTNPFLRAGEPSVKRILGMPDASDARAFAELRARKNRF